jgi:hypothetical protein
MKKHTPLYLVVFGITVVILIMYHFINTNYKSIHEDKKQITYLTARILKNSKNKLNKVSHLHFLN